MKTTTHVLQCLVSVFTWMKNLLWELG